MDSHHQTLARLINRCADSVASKANPDSIADMLTALVNYADYHFAFEEKLMADYGYDQAQEQRADHTAFSRVVADACYRATQGKADMPDLLAYLVSWWRDHILSIDMKYKPFFQSKGLS